jgi:hypothetical protein
MELADHTDLVGRLAREHNHVEVDVAIGSIHVLLFDDLGYILMVSLHDLSVVKLSATADRPDSPRGGKCMVPDRMAHS